MPTTIASPEEVNNAVLTFKHDMTDGDCSVDLSEVNMDELTKAVNDEYKCGFKGEVYDCVINLSDTIGLDEFGIYVII